MDLATKLLKISASIVGTVRTNHIGSPKK